MQSTYSASVLLLVLQPTHIWDTKQTQQRLLKSPIKYKHNTIVYAKYIYSNNISSDRLQTGIPLCGVLYPIILRYMRGLLMSGA